MEFERLQADVLVIGAGAAGCRAAIEAHDRGACVILASKGRFTYSGSTFYPLTPGLGYTSAVPGGDPAGPEAHYREILAAGLGMVSPSLACLLAEEAPARLLDLLQRLRMSFAKEDGQVLYIKPDFGSGLVRAGSASTEVLRAAFWRAVRERDIRLLDQTAVVRLLGDRTGCYGAVGVNRRAEVMAISAKATVLATGGGSTAFLYHMNTPDLTFDGHGMALQLGAQLVNMEFYQMILGLTAPVNRMLIPESYLSLGPDLTNGLGEEFLPRYLPPGLTTSQCLAMRAGTGPFRSDAATRYFDMAVFDEIRQGRGTLAGAGGVRADFTGCDPLKIRGGKLNWYNWAGTMGVNILARPVDISPHVHAFNGGIVIDAQAQTTVPNLFACGEAAGGPHGANRVGGNQFAGSQVFGARAGQYATERAKELAPPVAVRSQVAEVQERVATLLARNPGRAPAQLQRNIQAAMWNEMGVYKDAASLRRCADALETVEGGMTELYAPDGRWLFQALALPNLLATARAIVAVASLREESRGPHFRIDFPHRNDDRLGRPIFVGREADELICRFVSLA